VLLTVVDLPPITDTDDPRVLAVVAADNEDAPVAQLAVMLAPALLKGTATLAFASIWGTGLAVRHAGHVFVRSPILAGLTLAVVFMLLTDWRESALRHVTDASAAAKRVSTTALQQLARQQEVRQVADATLQALLVAPGAPTTISRFARELAVSSASADELLVRLGIESNELSQILRAGPIVASGGSLALGRRTVVNGT
jgi:hypothetical protein